MKKTKQIALTVLITFALVGLSWFAGQNHLSEKMRRVVTAGTDLPAGRRVSADQLVLKEIPETAYADCYMTDLAEAAGLWTTAELQAGEIISRKRLASSAVGLHYPDPGPGRRLMTLDLEPADANGYWLAAGNRVDLFLIPRNRDSIADTKIMENIRIMSVLSGNPDESAGITNGLNNDCLICFDLNSEQARLLGSAPGIYDIRLAAINEPDTMFSD